MDTIHTRLTAFAAALFVLTPAARAGAQGIIIDDFAWGTGGYSLTEKPPLRRGVTSNVRMVKLAPVVIAADAVFSLTLSRTDITSGGSATGTVTLNAMAGIDGTTVTLSSSKPEVAAVPASVTVRALSRTASFPVSAPAGAVGCATISARVGATLPKSRLLYVQPPVSPVTSPKLKLPSSAVAPQTITGRVTVSQGPAPGSTVAVPLSSSSPFAIVPASVTFSAFSTLPVTKSFPITIQDPGTPTCAVITASTGTQLRALLKITSASGLGVSP